MNEYFSGGPRGAEFDAMYYWNQFHPILAAVAILLIGWIVALVWSVTSDSKPQTIVVNNNSLIEPKNEFKTLSNQRIKSEQTNNSNLNSHQEKIQNLKKLKQLLDDGILTQEEFVQQKNQILG